MATILIVSISVSTERLSTTNDTSSLNQIDINGRETKNGVIAGNLGASNLKIKNASLLYKNYRAASSLSNRYVQIKILFGSHGSNNHLHWVVEGMT